MNTNERQIIHAALGATAVRPEQFPVGERVEVAFAGKSNVGKSSMVNTLLNRKSLVRTSRQPGKTRAINFFEAEEDWYFVDLPGYGYAKVSRDEAAKWGILVEGYLKNSTRLAAVVLLLDIRHEPNANDRMLYDWCAYYNLPVILVATKCDKVKRAQIPKRLAVIRKALGSKQTPLPFSSSDRTGREELWLLFEQHRERLLGSPSVSE
jgi:GTP-binding protein